VLELPTGTVRRTQTVPGDQIQFRATEAGKPSDIPAPAAAHA
jgi:uncharacterized membrane protein (UPF0127 family)